MMERLLFMGFRKKLKALHKTLLRSVQNAKEFKTKRLYVLMQTSLRFISNVLAFEIKRKGVFSSAFFTLLFMLELCPYKDFLITCN